MRVTNTYLFLIMSAILALITPPVYCLTPKEAYILGLLYHEEGDFVPSVNIMKQLTPLGRAPSLISLHALRTMHWQEASAFYSPDFWWYDKDIVGKKIFIKHDGGAGDAVQFLRYAQHLHNAGAYVMIETPPVLKHIYSRCAYIDQQIPYGSSAPDADVTITIATPVLTYTVRNDIKRCKNDVPYIVADPELCHHWRMVLAQLPGKKIGLSWCSSPLYNNDTGEKLPTPRSIPLALCEELLSYSPCTFINLQCGYGSEQLTEVRHCPIVFQNIDTHHGRFMDTMAIMCNLDLLITIDTSLAHIAGALGIPVWVILPKCSDFRWFTDRTDSPWYPSMRIFRQKPYEDWKPVLTEVLTALKALYHDN